MVNDAPPSLGRGGAISFSPCIGKYHTDDCHQKDTKSSEQMKSGIVFYSEEKGKPITTGTKTQITATTIRNRFTFYPFRSSSQAVL